MLFKNKPELQFVKLICHGNAANTNLIAWLSHYCLRQYYFYFLLFYFCGYTIFFASVCLPGCCHTNGLLFQTCLFIYHFNVNIKQYLETRQEPIILLVFSGISQASKKEKSTLEPTYPEIKEKPDWNLCRPWYHLKITDKNGQGICCLTWIK